MKLSQCLVTGILVQGLILNDSAYDIDFRIAPSKIARIWQLSVEISSFWPKISTVQNWTFRIPKFGKDQN